MRDGADCFAAFLVPLVLGSLLMGSFPELARIEWVGGCVVGMLYTLGE